jgi:SAM-dependent methyltransferase
MSGFDDPGFFGDRWADDYGNGPDPTLAVEFLAGLAGEGRVLELASGTGRVTLPLSARGVDVQGVEGSTAMVARMRERPGGAQIPVVVGDMADVPVSGPFELVFLVFDTLFNLPSPERQMDCFRNVAQVLAPDGAKQTITFTADGIRMLPVALRYCWPSELDLMASQAGLELQERYADWERRPFDSDSTSHISVYRPAAGASRHIRTGVNG